MISAYSIFKRPDLIAKGEPFLEVSLTRFQGRCHYTPNLAQEINLSRNQRQINVVRVCSEAWVAENKQYLPLLTAESQDTLGLGSSPRFRADSYNRCFRYLDCFRKGVALLLAMNQKPDRRRAPSNALSIDTVEKSVGRGSNPGVWPPFTKAVYLSSQVDRSQTRMPEGFNLRSQNCGQVAEWLCAVAKSLGICGAEASTQVRILPCPPIWQKSRRVPLGLNDDSGGHKALTVRTKAKPRLRKRTRELTQQYRPIRPKAPSYGFNN